MLVGFDRGGWSPTLFADLDAAGFDILTWRKGATADIDEHAFAEHTLTDEHGRTHTWRLADTEISLDIADGPRTGEVFAMRQISLFESTRTRQMHILTTAATCPPLNPLPDGLPLAPGTTTVTPASILTSTLRTHRAADDDPTRMVPNPAKNPPTATSRRPGGHCI